MKKHLILGILVLLVIVGIIVGFIFLLFKVSQNANNNAEEFGKYKTAVESNVGLRVILDKDTLTIVDYSIISQNYTLSNGNKISFKVIEKLEIIK